MRNSATATPVRGMGIVIHRGYPRWFSVNGERYDLLYNGPGYGWSIHEPESGATVGDNYFRLDEVRADAERAVAEYRETRR